MPTLKRILALACITVSLTACGYHLRGSTGTIGTTAMTYKTLSIISDDKSALRQQLSDLMRGQVTLVTAPASAQVTAEVGAIVHSRVVSNTNSAGRAIEYRLTTTATLQAYDAQKNILIAPVQIAVSRTLTIGDGYDTGSDLEESRLYSEMDVELANLMQYRLRAIKLNSAK